MRSWFTRLCLGAIACILAVAAVKYHPLVLHGSETSEVYRRYAQRDDLKVGFVKDYRINDTLAVDVTTITANDSASWEALLREMNINELIIKKQRESLRKGIYGVHTYYCMKGRPERRVSIKECDDYNLVVDSPRDRVFYIFDVNDNEQGKSIVYNKIKELLIK